MPKYRYWLLVDGEDEENDPTVSADNTAEAAELAAAELDSDGNDVGNSLELGIRMIGESGFPEGPVEMFEVYIDWSPSYIAHHRGTKT